MKTNKKAALGMIVAIVVSLGIMQKIGQDNHQNEEVSLQQVSVGCAYMAGDSEGGASSAWDRASDITGAVAAGMAINGAYHAYATTTNPVGWGYWAVTGVIGL